MKKIALAVAALATGIAAGLLLVSPVWHHASGLGITSRTKPDPALLVKRAVLMRALGIEAPGRMISVLKHMPAGILPHDQNLIQPQLALWSLFFKGTMTELGRLNSPDPLVLYYNPIDDVGLVVSCQYSRETGRPRCQEACAFPGETTQGAQPFQMPPWLLETQPFAAFLRNGDLRLTAFARAEPAKGTFSSAWPKTYCSTELQAAAEARLVAAARAMAHLNAHQLEAAVVRYLEAHTAAKAHRLAGSTPKSPADQTVRLLLNLADYAVSAGLPLPHRKWLVFLTPRVNGWGDAVLFLVQSRNGLLSIRGSRFFAFSTRAG